MKEMDWNFKEISPETAKYFMDNQSDFHRDRVEQIMKDVETKMEALIKSKLIAKGYTELAEMDERVRFPKINKSLYEGWIYVFADNGTKQGDFIIAVGPLEYDNNFDLSKISDYQVSAKTEITFKWQDTDFSPVAL